MNEKSFDRKVYCILALLTMAIFMPLFATILKEAQNGLESYVHDFSMTLSEEKKEEMEERAAKKDHDIVTAPVITYVFLTDVDENMDIFNNTAFVEKKLPVQLIFYTSKKDVVIKFPEKIEKAIDKEKYKKIVENVRSSEEINEELVSKTQKYVIQLLEDEKVQEVISKELTIHCVIITIGCIFFAFALAYSLCAFTSIIIAGIGFLYYINIEKIEEKENKEK